MLYEVAVIEKTEKKENLVLPPTAIIAKNENAAMVAAGKRPELSSLDVNTLEVLVRPFRG